jgi:cytochrome c5
VLALIALSSFVLLAHPGQDNNTVTTLNGIFTGDQAAKGNSIYQDKCSKCHDGDDAGGPTLVGRTFVDRWREDGLDVLFDFMKSNMPADSASSLSDTEYIDLVAHLLDSNGFPEGSKELTADALPKIRFVGKDGPKPLPNNTLIQAVGCLTQTGENEWSLTGAMPVSRTREGTETSPDELKKSAAKPLGSLRFNLQNFSRISLDFKPETFKDHKVQVKGVLIHQTNGNDRISLTLLNSLTASCTQ